MKFSIFLFSSVLLATTTLAAPHKNAGLARRLQRRTRTIRDSGNRAKNSGTKTEATSAATTSSAIQYSENWSGMAITSPPTGQTFNAVSGKFTVPSPSVPSGVDATDGEYSASAWVGIDGNTYSTAILQTGVDFTVSTSGEVSYDAWYEWYPDYAYDFDIDISAGDVSLLHPLSYTSLTLTGDLPLRQRHNHHLWFCHHRKPHYRQNRHQRPYIHVCPRWRERRMDR